MTVCEFQEIDPEVLNRATEKALEALDSERTPRLLVEFYDTATNFAGSTFAMLQPRDAGAVTATDLLALRTLSIKLGAYEIRQFLDGGPNERKISQLLGELPSAELQNTNAADFSPMAAFYDEVKRLLAGAGTKNSNRWVAASKLTARKRPDLFPVRDRVVCGYLGILKQTDRARDWYVFRHLMRNSDITSRLSELPARIAAAANGRDVRLDEEPLRLLDAVLWRYAMTASTEIPVDDEDARGESESD